MIKIKTFLPNEKLPEGVILPTQTHGINIREIKTSNEDLSDCDGIYTTGKFLLGIKTADCAPVVFVEGDKFGIVHAGWRGFCGGIIEKMLVFFEEPKIFIAPFMHSFEIQKDDCFFQIKNKFGEQFLTYEEEKIVFDFQGAIKNVLPQVIIDDRNTFFDTSLASWRRDKTNLRNITVVGRF